MLPWLFFFLFRGEAKFTAKIFTASLLNFHINMQLDCQTGVGKQHFDYNHCGRNDKASGVLAESCISHYLFASIKCTL